MTLPSIQGLGEGGREAERKGGDRRNGKNVGVGEAIRAAQKNQRTPKSLSAVYSQPTIGGSRRFRRFPVLGSNTAANHFTIQAPSPAQPLSHRSHRATKSSEQVKSRAFPAGKPQSTNHRSGDGSWCSRTCPHNTQTTRGQHDKSAPQALTFSTQRALEMSWSSTQTECYVHVALHARFTAIGDGL